MSSFFGHYMSLTAILLLIIIIIQSILYKKENKKSYKISIEIIISVYFILITFSFLLLLKSHILSDLSIMNVINNTHSKQPLIYKICALWGNHEGSMLLWCWILSVYTYSTLFLRKINIELLRHTIITQSFINLFFLLFTLLTSNPFLQVFYRSIEGKELNPILQDIVLVIHPPFVYLGYLGLSIPFALTIAFLIKQRNNTNIWLYYVHIYNTISWCFLTFGIFLGSWWAYYELGWGGWWFWDPVENASLMPWILSTALLHTTISTKKTKTLTKTTIYLSLFTFYSSILGTFFVRSGLVDSVHSFASDSNRGLLIFIFISILSIYCISLLIKHTRYIKYENILEIFSKEGLILLNQFFFISFYITVLIGTFYPTLHFYFLKESITVGPSFYNQILIPILVPFFILMNTTLYLHWNSLKKFNIKLHTNEIIYIIGTIIGIYIFLYLESYHRFNILLLFIPLLIWSIIKHLKSIVFNKEKKSYSMIFSHFGVTIFISSVLLWYCLHKESHQIMFPGDRYQLDNYQYIFKGINIIKGPNYDAFYGSFLILKENIVVGILFPEKRHYLIQNFYASKVDIHSNLLYDVHAIIGDGNLYTGWTTSFYTYPFLSWIWISSLFLIIGGIYSIYTQIKKKQKIIIYT